MLGRPISDLYSGDHTCSDLTIPGVYVLTLVILVLHSHCTLRFCVWLLYDISGCRVMLSYNHNYRRIRAVVGFSYKISYFDTWLWYGSSRYPVMLSCNNNNHKIRLHLINTNVWETPDVFLCNQNNYIYSKSIFQWHK